MTIQNPDIEQLEEEINELTNALKNENEITSQQEFYVKMFQHVSYEVQHKILMMTVNHTDNSLNQCKLLLLVLKRFPEAAATHSVGNLSIVVKNFILIALLYNYILASPFRNDCRWNET